MELCKFYAVESCFKREHCLYLHKSFPCKLFHTGAQCLTDNKCKFSHEPLTDITRSILLKVILLEILPSFCSWRLCLYKASG